MVTDSMRVSEKNSIWNPIESLTEKRQNFDDKMLPPEKMAAIWNFGVYEKPGSPNIRGLGGRIYFYDANNNVVTAEGELTVYGFDDESGSRTKPDKKFIFRESEFQTHFSESALGGSYSIWIPWDKVGGYRKSVTLLPVFKTTDGKIIESEQSINLLAGKVKKAESLDSTHPYRVLGSSAAVLGDPSDKRSFSRNVAQASYDDSEGQGGSDSGAFKQRIRTTEISLTPNLRRQVELAAQLQDGKKPFSNSAVPQASTAQSPFAPAPSMSQNVARIPASVANPGTAFNNQPVSRTSTTAGGFGRPGSFR